MLQCLDALHQYHMIAVDYPREEVLQRNWFCAWRERLQWLLRQPTSAACYEVLQQIAGAPVSAQAAEELGQLEAELSVVASGYAKAAAVFRDQSQHVSAGVADSSGPPSVADVLDAFAGNVRPVVMHALAQLHRTVVGEEAKVADAAQSMAPAGLNFSLDALCTAAANASHLLEVLRGSHGADWPLDEHLSAVCTLLLDLRLAAYAFIFTDLPDVSRGPLKTF